MRRLRARGDDGTILLLAVILMTPLLTISALALDIGNAYQQRRKAQNSVDAAVFAAGRDLLEPNNTSLIVSTAKSFALENYGTPASAWNGCRDSGALSVRPDFAANDNTCISTNARMNAIRIRLPNSNVDTGFARIIGVDTLQVNALAGGQLRLRGPGILPFGLPSMAATGIEVCLRSGSAGHAEPPCDGASSGNLGWLDIPLHGNTLMGTLQDCTPDTGTLATNLIHGADHPLGTWETGDPKRSDTAQCPVDTPPPNQLEGQTGLSSALDPGFVGRLQDTPYDKRLVRVGTAQLDDTPLWEFIDPDLEAPAIPESCERSEITTKALMGTCLADFKVGGYTTPLFTVDSDPTDNWYDIELSPRFGYVPQLWQDEWSVGKKPYEIKSFKPIFIQTAYIKCTATACDGEFDPGEPGSGLPVASNKNVEQMTALLIPEAMLPIGVQTKGPADGGNVEVVLTD